MTIPASIISSLHHWQKEANIIGLGEAHHVPAVMQCYIQLLLSDGMADCRHIVVEFGVQQHQALVDRYINGESLTIHELSPVWRDSPLHALWEYDCYKEFFKAIRQINLLRQSEQRLQIWLAEPFTRAHYPAKQHEAICHQQDSATQLPSIRQELRTQAFVSLISRLSSTTAENIVLIFGMRHLSRSPINGRNTLAHELIRLGKTLRTLWPEMPPRFYVRPPPAHRLEWIAMQGSVAKLAVAPWGGDPRPVSELCDAVLRIPDSYRSSPNEPLPDDPSG